MARARKALGPPPSRTTAPRAGPHPAIGPSLRGRVRGRVRGLRSGPWRTRHAAQDRELPETGRQGLMKYAVSSVDASPAQPLNGAQGPSARIKRQACAADRDGTQGAKRSNRRNHCGICSRRRPPETTDAHGALIRAKGRPEPERDQEAQIPTAAQRATHQNAWPGGDMALPGSMARGAELCMQ